MPIYKAQQQQHHQQRQKVIEVPGASSRLFSVVTVTCAAADIEHLDGKLPRLFAIAADSKQQCVILSGAAPGAERVARGRGIEIDMNLTWKYLDILVFTLNKKTFCFKRIYKLRIQKIFKIKKNCADICSESSKKHD